MINRSVGLWTVRLLLAALFCFGCEVILWTNPLDHNLMEWVIRIFGYTVLATITLDIAQRYRIRDGFDAMVLIAGSALVYNLLINPTMGWMIIPDSLITRIIGGDALVQLILWGVFLAWMRGDTPKYGWQHAVAGFWLAVYWGFWMRWTPELRGTFEAVPLMQLYIIAGISFAVIALFYLLIVVPVAQDVTAEDFILSPLEWALIGMVIISLFLAQAVLGTIGAVSFFVTGILLALIWLILWLRHDRDETTILDKHTPIVIMKPRWIALWMLAFSITLGVTYNLPLITEFGQINQLWLMEVGSAGVGILWLPLVASVIAIRAMDRYMRQGVTF